MRYNWSSGWVGETIGWTEQDGWVRLVRREMGSLSLVCLCVSPVGGRTSVLWVYVSPLGCDTSVLWVYVCPVGGGTSIWVCWCATLCCFLLWEKAAARLQMGIGCCWFWGESGSVIQILSISLNDYYPSDLWVGLLLTENTVSDGEAALAGCVEVQTVALGHCGGGSGDGCNGSRFMSLTAEKWTPQRQVVLKKTERFGGLNTSMSQTGWMRRSPSLFWFYLTFISFRLVSWL